MKAQLLLFAALFAGIPACALAQTQTSPTSSVTTSPSLTAGAKVYDAAGDEVGTIVSVDGGTIVLDTGTNRASLAASSFTTNARGLLIGMTTSQERRQKTAFLGPVGRGWL